MRPLTQAVKVQKNMPIRIDKKQKDERNKEVAWICDDEWELPSLIYGLEKWLKENHQKPNGGNQTGSHLNY